MKEHCKIHCTLTLALYPIGEVSYSTLTAVWFSVAQITSTVSISTAVKTNGAGSWIKRCLLDHTPKHTQNTMLNPYQNKDCHLYSSHLHTDSSSVLCSQRYKYNFHQNSSEFLHCMVLSSVCVCVCFAECYSYRACMFYLYTVHHWDLCSSQSHIDNSLVLCSHLYKYTLQHCSSGLQ